MNNHKGGGGKIALQGKAQTVAQAREKSREIQTGRANKNSLLSAEKQRQGLKDHNQPTQRAKARAVVKYHNGNMGLYLYRFTLSQRQR